MKTIKIVLTLICAATLMGCADSSTRSGDDKDIRVTIEVTARDDAAVYLNPDVDAWVKANDEVKQDTSNQAELDAEGKVAAALEGAAASTSRQESVSAESRPKINSENQEKKTNTNITENAGSPATTCTNGTTGEAGTPEVVGDQPVASTEGVVIEMKPYEDKSFTWLHKLGKASELRGALRFVFDNGCGEFTVPDATKTYYPSRDDYVYYAGQFQEGSDEEWTYGDVASVFTRKGCVANEVTVYH